MNQKPIPENKEISFSDMQKKLEYLMDEKNYRLAGTVSEISPDGAGMYCIRIKDIHTLPPPFNSYLSQRGHNILYIGIASKSLNKRFHGQELHAIGHGTFFRGIGAVLGYRPPKGSLIGKANKNNYKFSDSDQKSIVSWIDKNLMINWVLLNENLDNIETALILKYRPLLNTDKNPNKLKELADLRAECRRIANNR